MVGGQTGYPQQPSGSTQVTACPDETFVGPSTGSMSHVNDSNGPKRVGSIHVNKPAGRTWPKARNLPGVFPTYLCRIIIKENGNAAITESFPKDPAECCLDLKIAANQVPHVAKELYGVHIDIVQGERSIILDNGVEVEINGTISLRRASNVAASKLFGPQVGMAYRSSSRFLSEQYLGEDLTRCVSMTVARDAHLPGSLSLNLDAENLTTIGYSLWQAKGIPGEVSPIA